MVERCKCNTEGNNRDIFERPSFSRCTTPSLDHGVQTQTKGLRLGE